MEAVQNSGSTIEYIAHPSAEVQLASVQRNGNAIKYILDPSPEVKLAAVQQCGDAIKHIMHPSIELQKLAISRSIKNALYITDINTDIKDLLILKINTAQSYNNIYLDSIKRMLKNNIISNTDINDNIKLLLELNE